MNDKSIYRFFCLQTGSSQVASESITVIKDFNITASIHTEHADTGFPHVYTKVLILIFHKNGESAIFASILSNSSIGDNIGY